MHVLVSVGHDELRLLERTLTSIASQSYPVSLVRVIVAYDPRETAAPELEGAIGSGRPPGLEVVTIETDPDALSSERSPDEWCFSGTGVSQPQARALTSAYESQSRTFADDNVVTVLEAGTRLPVDTFELAVAGLAEYDIVQAKRTVGNADDGVLPLLESMASAGWSDLCYKSSKGPSYLLGSAFFTEARVLADLDRWQREADGDVPLEDERDWPGKSDRETDEYSCRDGEPAGMSGIDVEPVGEEAEDASSGDDGAHTIEVTPTDSVADDERETIDVEPSDEPIDGPDYVLYGGKGGVGKTTMAAATALDSARAGTSTLVVSTDPAHSLSDTFETEVPSEPGRLRDDIPLYAAEIDPEAAMERGQAAFLGGGGGGDSTGTDDGSAGFGGSDDAFGGSDQGPFGGGTESGGMGGMGGLGDMLGGESPMDAIFGGAMPGADEAAAMQLLLEYMDDPRFDRVVVDTAPTGHTLRLLQLPELMDTMMGKILKFRKRMSGMLEGMKGMFGGQEPPEEDDLDDLDELRDRIERLRAVLRDPARTDFRIVMVPEEMSVLESKRLRQQLREFDIPVGTLVVNRVMEPLSDVTDDVEGEFLQPNLDDCEFCQRRWDVQQNALAEAQDLFRGTDVRRVPLFADEVRGEEMLEVVAACLR